MRLVLQTQVQDLSLSILLCNFHLTLLMILMYVLTFENFLTV